ncbi:WCX domain-containing protein [Aidingimonas lacisalsi]|uniref:WYL domain-containing protein n=1 Tax=Aidingimonas lacisalsi TaxID=2604086 RepID=UPI0011D2A9A5|nr:WYL domain-containing protein [Aidingimonas lacisalsi]
MTPLPDSDWQWLEAKVPDDQQPLWWLMGMGVNIQVNEPAGWRDEIRNHAKAILEQAAPGA